jgi:hypothetical protein
LSLNGYPTSPDFVWRGHNESTSALADINDDGYPDDVNAHGHPDVVVISLSLSEVAKAIFRFSQNPSNAFPGTQ